MKSTLQLIALLAVAVVCSADRLHPRGRVRWPGIRLGEALAVSDILTEPITVDDLTEENLLKALIADQAEGSGSEPVEESGRLDEKTDNKNASYHFRSHIKDGIKGGQLHREETRRGQRVTGSYSYSDGFVLRTVQYEADENGYRVVKETMRRIGNGPKENDVGVANVQTEAHGRKHRYTVRGSDLVDRGL